MGWIQFITKIHPGYFFYLFNVATRKQSDTRDLNLWRSISTGVLVWMCGGDRGACSFTFAPSAWGTTDKSHLFPQHGRWVGSIYLYPRPCSPDPTSSHHKISLISFHIVLVGRSRALTASTAFTRAGEG